ncbi:MAG: AAA family ATPase [Nitrospirae bacterium]|nr:AAA family ATPase [Nitrospirota bacterium]
MYEKFFGFAEEPFRLTPDPRYFFFSKKHEEAFSNVIYGIKERKGFIVITGEVGTGKTTLCRFILNRLDPKIKTSLIFNPNLTTIELLQTINQDFGLSGKSTSKKELIDELNGFLISELSSGGNALLIIDEGQNLPIECMEEIRMLSNLETEDKKLLQILLAGQPELNEKLKLNEMRQLNQRISLRYHIDPLDQTETKEYIMFRLKVAGGREKVHFTNKAIERIYRYSSGIPRLVNIISDKALLAAYVAEARVVTPHIVDGAKEELEGMHQAARRLGYSWIRLRDDNDRIFTRSGVVVIIFLLILTAIIWSYRPGAPEKVEVKVKEGGMANMSQSTLPSEPQPQPPFSPAFDKEGIFRIREAGGAEIAAYLTLIKIWNKDFDYKGNIEQVEQVEIDDLLEEAGLYRGFMPLDVNRLIDINYPFIIKAKVVGEDNPYYAVVSEVKGDDLVLLDPIRGRREESISGINGQSDGEVVILWRGIGEISIPLDADGESQAISDLQGSLKEAGLYKGRIDGVMGRGTKRGIRSLHKMFDIQEEGFGIESYLFLSRLIFGGDIPSLKNDAGEQD